MAFEKPIPSRLTLIRLRSQERLYKSIKKTVEDARNATIQRIRTIIPRLEETKRELVKEIGEVSIALKLAASRLSLEELGKLSELIKPTVTASLVERSLEGIRYVGIEFNGLMGPNYSIYGIPPELDSALHGLLSNMKLLVEVINLENLFYTLLARVKEYQRMVNAIDNIVLPRIAEASRNVRLALDEEEREEFIRRSIISKLLA